MSMHRTTNSQMFSYDEILLISKSANTRESSRVTIRTVAIMAGVSIATVSNVINKKGKVSRATEDRITMVIQTMKWKPNVNARNLASGGNR